ncbi:O-antigen ligase family protein [Parendozoicomonas sp. Alg238-R29]|uniref:O-antigen ligase family protein n=1 Tax=Parendozoicomonas sp. Alg238-R29 TaxID=2993446 RepID=UPI00248EDF15|nr:O-antigen ligase family protein [Parendozoicomonas sp. Alg238-R29]
MHKKLNVQSLIYTGLFLFVLMVGVVGVEERLVFFGVPTNILISLFVLFVVLYEKSGRWFTLSLYRLLPVTVVFLTLFYSSSLDYGIFKSLNLFVVTILCLSVLALSVDRFGSEAVVFSIVVILLVLLVITSLYKLNFGFWDRGVRFFLNGPIVFGRLMAMGLICTLFLDFNKKIKVIVSFLFFVSVLWTQSKGPLLSATLCLLYFFYKETGMKGYFLILMSGASIFFCVIFGSLILEILVTLDSPLLSRIIILINGDDVSNYGSVGSRVDAIETSMHMIWNHLFFGVGVGSWGEYAGYFDIYYPHNFVMEVFSELGLFLGCIFAYRYFDFFKAGYNVYSLLALMFLLNQMVSGDLLDSRYVLVFSVFSLIYKEYLLVEQSGND